MSQDLFERGLEVRRKIRGAAETDRAIAAADEFSRPLEEVVTEYCYGAIWSRPGLAPKIRSMLNIAMMCALNRPTELRENLRGALEHGATKEEIVEILLQANVYCGSPTGVEGFRAMREVFAEVPAR